VKLTIPRYSLYTFVIGGLVCLVWCITMLALSSLVKRPRASFFPEIDILSEGDGNDDYSTSWHSRCQIFSRWAAPLSNSTSFEIRRVLGVTRIFLRSSDGGKRGPILLASLEEGRRGRTSQGYSTVDREDLRAGSYSD